MLTSLLALALVKSPATVTIGPRTDALYPGYAVGRAVHVTFPGSSSPRLRVSVNASDARLADDLDWAAEAAARCWDLAYDRFGLDVPATVEGQTVHLLLREDGVAGGEQKLSRPAGDTSPLPWSTVLLYQVPSLTSPLERWREVAHEYGHAVFPAWGPYRGPESWSNGDIGERALTFWAAKSDPALQSYVEAKVIPLAVQGAKQGPWEAEGSDEAAYWGGVNLVCYALACLPSDVVRRGLGLSGGQSAMDFADGLAEAVAEQPSVTLTLPAGAVGSAVWVPAGRVQGHRVVARRGGWSKVLASSRALKLMP